MKPAWDGILGWVLVLVALGLLAWASTGVEYDGRHVLAVILGSFGVGLIRHRLGEGDG